MSGRWLLGPVASVLVAVAATAAAWAVAGPKAGAGAALGLLGTSASVLGTWILVRLAGRSAATDHVPAFETLGTLFLFFLKVPAVLFAMAFAFRLGSPAPGGFLLGMGLVYSRLIAQAFVRA